MALAVTCSVNQTLPQDSSVFIVCDHRMSV